jgi:hypothetical protein
MTDIKIESHIPIPIKKRGNRKYPWDQMKVGDSFFVEGVTQNSLSTAAKYQTTKSGIKFTTAAEGSGIRVWRIA